MTSLMYEYRGQTLFIEILSWSSPLHHAYHSFSVLRTSQMTLSLRRSIRSVIVCLIITIATKDPLAIIPSLRDRMRVAGYSGSGHP